KPAITGDLGGPAAVPSCRVSTRKFGTARSEREWSFGVSGSFYQSERTCWTRVSTLYPKRRCNQHEPALTNLREIGDELNHRDAFFEQCKMICHPHFPWV